MGADRAASLRIAGRPAARAAWPTHRLVAVWLAIFALYVQLLAAVACTSGFTQSSAGAGSFPICHHAQAGSETAATLPNGGRGTPDQPRQGCPFCSIHCHATLVLAQTAGLAAPVLLGWTSAELAPIVARPAILFHVGAQPRGPPLGR